jgi:hypothetical protein
LASLMVTPIQLGRLITAVLRPAKRPGGKEIRAFLAPAASDPRQLAKHQDPAARR